MKKNQITTLLVLITFNFTYAQNINMELLDPQPFLQGSETGDMEFADLDGDGDMDLVSTGSGNMSDGTTHSALTTLYFNDGVGNFTAVTNHGIENIRSSKIALADIDGDDDLDLMISGQTQGGSLLTKLYANDGNGNFNEIVNSEIENLERGYFNFGDIDGDSDQDIVYSGSDLLDIIAFINDGSGNYSLDGNIGITGITGVLDLFDADGDDDLDLLIMGIDQNDQDSTRLYINNGTGDFTIASGAGFNPLSFGDIATGDTDGDGDLDVLITGFFQGSNVQSTFYINNGDGTFTLMEDDPFMDLGFDGETSFNDFDNDGDLDVFIIGSAEGGLPNIFSHIYENQGSNNFILSDEFTGAYLSTHAVADIDGDALLDVVIGGITTGNPVRGSFMYKNVSLLNTNDETFRKKINIYPNPSDDIINISSNNDQLLKIELYNMTGSLIFKTDLNSDIYSLNIANYQSGIYLLRVFGQNNDTINTKIVKK